MCWVEATTMICTAEVPNEMKSVIKEGIQVETGMGFIYLFFCQIQNTNESALCAIRREQMKWNEIYEGIYNWNEICDEIPTEMKLTWNLQHLYNEICSANSN